MRRRSATVTLGLTTVLAATLTGCASGSDTGSDAGPVPLVAEATSSAVETSAAGGTVVDEGNEATTEATEPDGTTTSGDGDSDTDDAATDGSGTDDVADDGSDDGADGPVQYTAVCVDETGEQRVDDAACDGVDPQQQRYGHSGHAWYFLRAGSAFPGVGSRIRGGSFTPPASSYAIGGLPATKGTVTTHASLTRGGFGGSARSGHVGG